MFGTIRTTVTALLDAAYMWLNGDLDVPNWDREGIEECIAYLRTLPQAKPHEVKVDLLTLLLDCKVGRYFNLVASHRRCVKHFFAHMKSIGAIVPDEDMEKRIKNHDLYRYGPQQALGFTMMHGLTAAPWHRLRYDDLRAICDQAITFRFQHSTYLAASFPEERSPRNASFPEKCIPRNALIQGMLDVIADYLDSQLANSTPLSLNRLMSVRMNTYDPSSRRYIVTMLHKWKGIMDRI